MTHEGYEMFQYIQFSYVISDQHTTPTTHISYIYCGLTLTTLHLMVLDHPTDNYIYFRLK